MASSERFRKIDVGRLRVVADSHVGADRQAALDREAVANARVRQHAAPSSEAIPQRSEAEPRHEGVAARLAMALRGLGQERVPELDEAVHHRSIAVATPAIAAQVEGGAELRELGPGDIPDAVAE